MRKWLLDLGLAVLMVWSVTVLASLLLYPKEQPLHEPETTDAATVLTIALLVDGQKEVVPLEDYLVGVLLGELPADFHPEAKKAQAIAARTYALRVAEKGVKHGYGVVCGEPGCCQNYVSIDNYVEKWGTEAPVNSAREAVKATEGMVVTYNGDLIDATYFSSSGGKTEAAVAVWGADVPYLQSVQSPGEDAGQTDVQTTAFSRKAFCEALGVELSGAPKEWFGNVTYTSGGGVAQLVIGGIAYRGTELRTKLGLRSTVFTVSTVEDGVLVTCRGFGHRVGMSQYGANAMATQGSSCEEILHHYYQNVEIVKR